ncbi:hypothetical protein [Priestia megaterium]|nr:hypothetical protein [Priestia megaterium]
MEKMMWVYGWNERGELKKVREVWVKMWEGDGWLKERILKRVIMVDGF